MSRLRAYLEANKPPSAAPAKQRYHGVVWRGNKQKAYRVKVRKGNAVFYKEFKDAEVAARVYDCAARMVRGPDAKLNFDGEPPAHISKAQIRQWLLDAGLLKPKTSTTQA